MGEKNTVVHSLWSLWLVIFVVVKVAGTSLSAWSWLWVLLPIVPVLAFVCQKLGWTL